jgi:hypothetical protein
LFHILVTFPIVGLLNFYQSEGNTFRDSMASYLMLLILMVEEQHESQLQLGVHLYAPTPKFTRLVCLSFLIGRQLALADRGQRHNLIGPVSLNLGICSPHPVSFHNLLSAVD